MRKIIQLGKFFQTNGYTCGPSCLLSILNYYEPEKFPLTQEMEMEIWGETNMGKYPQCPHPALAFYAMRRGFKARTYHKDGTYFIRNTKSVRVLEKDVFDSKMAEYNKYMDSAKKEGLEVKIADFEVEDLLHHIDDGQPIILLLEYGSELHHIVVHGYDEHVAYVMNPLAGNEVINLKRLNSKVDLLIGKGACVIWK